MAAPETEARLRIAEVLDAEFAGEGITCEPDRLGESVAQDRPRMACYPDVSEEVDDAVLQLRTRLVVQLFRQWEPRIDPEQRVDPTAIEEWVHRFRIAIRAQSSGNSEDLWFLRMRGADYAPDPTGNISRATCYVEAWASNPAVVETTA